MIFELAKDIHDAIRMMPREHSKHRILELLEEAIHRDIHFIASHPTTLFQCMWNTCWWYDCPDAAKHYEGLEDRWQATSPWENHDEKCYPLLESWRDEKQALISGFFWLRSRRPPLVRLGSALRMVLQGHSSELKAVAFTRNSRHIASVSIDGTMKVWDAASGCDILSIEGHANMAFVTDSSPDNILMQDLGRSRNLCVKVLAAGYTPDGSRIGMALEDNTIRILDTKSGAEIQRLKAVHSRTISITYCADGRQVVAEFWHDGVRLWDKSNGQVLGYLRGYTACVRCAAISSDGDKAVSGSDDGSIRVWKAATGQLLLILDGHKEPVLHVAFSPLGDRIVSISEDRTLRVWDVERGIEIAHHTDLPAKKVAFSSDGKAIIVALDDDSLLVWNDGNVRIHSHSVEGPSCIDLDSIQFSSSGFTIRDRAWEQHRSSSHDMNPDYIRLVYNRCMAAGGSILKPSFRQDLAPIVGVQGCWGSIPDDELQKFRLRAEKITCVAFSPDGSWLAAGAGDQGDRSIRIWDVGTGETICCLRGHDDDVRSVAFSPDSRRVISRSSGWIYLWSIENGIELWRFKSRYGNCVAYSPDGRRFAIDSGQDIQVWDAECRLLLQCFRGHENDVQALTFSTDGQILASASSGDFVSDNPDASVRLWSVDSGAELKCFRTGSDAITCIAFEPDNSAIIAGYKNERVCVWSLERELGQAHIQGEKDSVIRSVACSHDGCQLAVGRTDGCIQFWDIQTGLFLQGTKEGKDWVDMMQFSPDGNQLLSVSNSTLHIWNSHNVEHLFTLNAHQDAVECSTYSLNGQMIASGGGYEDGYVCLWNSHNGALLYKLGGYGGDDSIFAEGSCASVESLDFALKGDLIIARFRGSLGWEEYFKLFTMRWEEGFIVIWDTRTGQFAFSIPCIVHISHAPDGSQALKVSGFDRVNAETEEGKPLWSVQIGTQVLCADYCPSGKFIAMGLSDGTLSVRKSKDGGEVMRLVGHESEIEFVTYSLDGTCIITWSVDGTLRVWNVEKGSQLLCVAGQNPAVTSAMHSPDGRRILVGFNDGRMQTLDSATGVPLWSSLGHGTSKVLGRYSHDGMQILSCTLSPLVALKVLDANTGACLRVIQCSGGIETVQSVRDLEAKASYQIISADLGMCVVETASKRPVAWFSTKLYPSELVPNRHTWVGISGSHPYILSLEGN
jgi:WD40 repeat protein